VRVWSSLAPVSSREAKVHRADADEEMGDAEMMSLNWFRVRWKTKCGKCERELVEGDWAAYSREEKGVLVCKPCGKEEEGEE
jgi:RNase P subunit RPR2